MTSAFSGLPRALAARATAAALPRAVGPAAALIPAFLAGVRCYSKEELLRRRRTLIMSNVPWELRDDEVKVKVEGISGFESIEPVPEHKGKYRVAFENANKMHRARKRLCNQFWSGRNIIAVGEHTRPEEPEPSRTLHIRGIPPAATDEALTRLFHGIRGNPRISVPKSQRWMGYIGYAKVDFDTIHAAAAAKELLNGRKVGEQPVVCQFSFPLERRYPRSEVEDGEEGGFGEEDGPRQGRRG